MTQSNGWTGADGRTEQPTMSVEKVPNVKAVNYRGFSRYRGNFQGTKNDKTNQENTRSGKRGPGECGGCKGIRGGKKHLDPQLKKIPHESQIMYLM